MNAFSRIYEPLAPASLAEEAARSLAALESTGFPRRIADRDHTLWRQSPDEITNRLGWLDTFDWMRPAVRGIRAFAESLRSDGVRDVVLLGMGGSSLAPEVFSRMLAGAPGAPRLHVLDTTSPRRIRRVTASVDVKSLHVVAASKSGTTIEVDTLLAHFDELIRAEVAPSGNHFSAITDPGTPLEQLAAERGFRRCFSNAPDIGGRYSALSYFGMVPAGILGADLETLLARAHEMAEACGGETSVAENPGCVFGALLGAAARAGRNKLTILTSRGAASFGLWAEQLIAESTGKEGGGIVPVVGETFEPEEPLGDDRLFVVVRALTEESEALDRQRQSLAERGEPVWSLDLADPLSLGAEMYRWEYATAVAGHLLGIHPFDQPDVQAAKARTMEILRGTGEEAAGEAGGPGAEELLRGARPGDYVALMVYGDPDAETESALGELRRAIRGARGVATTLGIGPRFLHSTGQLHKGGVEGVICLQWVLDEGTLPVPGRPLGFGELLSAQADGDLKALREAGRAAARVDSSEGAPASIRALIKGL